MQEICKRVIEQWDEQGLSMAEMVRRTQLGESTLRRFRAGDKDVSVNTLVTIAQAVGITADDMVDMLPVKTAVAVKMMEQEFKPHSEQCANACPARKAMNETITQISDLYEKRLEERKQLYDTHFASEEKLYERALEKKNEQLAHKDTEIAAVKAEAEVRIGRFRWGLFILLGLVLVLVAFILYLIFVDFSNPNEGILTTDLLINALEEAGYQIIAP